MFVKTKAFRSHKFKNRDLIQNILILAAFAALILGFSILSPYYLRMNNVISMLAMAVPLGLIGIGESACQGINAFDMSPAMVASLAGVFWATLVAKLGVPVYLAFFLCLIFGSISGLLAGYSVAYLRMPAWMATYALTQAWRGIIFVLTNGNAIGMNTNKVFKFLGQHKLFGTPITWAAVILVVVYILSYLVLRFTKFGLDYYAVGGNIEAAKNSGIRVKLVQIVVFVVSGTLSALAGLLFASRAGSAQSTIGDLYVMQAIAGATIGGTRGGKLNLGMVFIGIMFMVCLQNGLTMIYVPAYYQHIVTGALLVVAILVQTDWSK